VAQPPPPRASAACDALDEDQRVLLSWSRDSPRFGRADGGRLLVVGVQDHGDIAELPGAGFQGVQDPATEPLLLQRRRHPHAFEFCRLLVDMSQGSHRGDSVVEDADEEVAARGEVALLDLLEVVIPGTGARVSADGCERDPCADTGPGPDQRLGSGGSAWS